MLITFEGGDGSGKTTQAALLAERLRRDGYEDVVLLREPGGTRLGTVLGEWVKGRGEQRMRLTPLAEMFLFAASRAQLVEEVIGPALLRPGAVVICDRYMDSTTAYQGFGRGIDLAVVRAANEFAVGECVPDLTLLLDLSAEEARRRLVARRDGGHQAALEADPRDGGPPRVGARRAFEDDRPAFQARVCEGYRLMAAEEPERWRVLDAAMPEGEIADRVRTLAEAALTGIDPVRDAEAGYQGSLFDGGE